MVLDTMTKTIGRLRSQGHEVVMLSAYPEDDQWIIGMMAELGTPLPYLAGYTDLGESMRLLASADLVIGERLHAAILAAACLTPFVALQYRPKVLDFTKSIDQVEATVRTDEMGRLDEVVDHVFAHRQQVSGAIAGPVTAFRAKQREAADWIQSFLRDS
jgi:polysaccharide pyruvyl transferase WcaK-like protein